MALFGPQLINPFELQYRSFPSNFDKEYNRRGFRERERELIKDTYSSIQVLCAKLTIMNLKYNITKEVKIRWKMSV